MDKEAVREELNKIRAEIRTLKSDFNSKRNEKEAHFVKGEEYSEEINSLYEEVKKIETEHNLDKINSDLEESKKEYDLLKSDLEKLELQFNDMKKSHPKPNYNSEKPVIKTISIDKARKEIKQLDTKLQTQVLSLEKESELIKKIQELKSITGLVSDDSSSSSDNNEFKELKKKVNSTRKKFYIIEKKIRSLYKQIRLISKEKKLRYKQIDSLRALKKESFESFRSSKNVYSGVGKNLKDLFKKEEEILISLGESVFQKRKVADKNLKVKQKEAEDNLLKKGGTLTTEDLLLFQKGK